MTDAEALAILQRTQFEQENFGYTIEAGNKSSVKLSIKSGVKEFAFSGISLGEAFAKARQGHAIPRIRPSILVKLLGAVTHDDRGAVLSTVRDALARIDRFAWISIHNKWTLVAGPRSLTLTTLPEGKPVNLDSGWAAHVYSDFSAELAAAPFTEIAATLERWDRIPSWLNGLAAEGTSRKDPEVETEGDLEAKKMIYARLTALKLS